MKTRMLVRISILSTFVFVGALLGCSSNTPTKPLVVINSPPNGMVVDANNEVLVQVTGTDSVGVVRIELGVNGVLADSQTSPMPGGQPVFPIMMRWTPKVAGPYILQVVAYNRDGAMSMPAVVSIQVREVNAKAPSVSVTPPPTQPPANSPPTEPAANPPPTQPPANPPPAEPPPANPPPAEPPPANPPPAEPPPANPPPVGAVPSKPTNFNAVGTGTSIQFTWTDNSLDELGFRIYQSGVVAPVVTRPAHAATGGMSYTWNGAPCNIFASFTIKAYNGTGESFGTGYVAETVPCAPSNFVATGASQSSVNVSFTDNSTNESGFRVYRTGSGTALENLNAHNGTGATNGTANPVICGETYTYYVRAWNSAGESSSSNTNSGTTNACTVTVTFTSFDIVDDSDGGGSGELWFVFAVNGEQKRYPTSGRKDWSSGHSYNITPISFTKTLMRNQNLVIAVDGYDNDSPLPDDKLGAIDLTETGAQNWGEGPKHLKSSCPDGCYWINFTIAVAP